MPNTRALQPPWRSLCSASSGFDSRPHLPCVSFHEVKLCPRLFDRGCVAAGGESHLANFSGGVILRSATCPRQIPSCCRRQGMSTKFGVRGPRA